MKCSNSTEGPFRVGTNMPNPEKLPTAEQLVGVIKRLIEGNDLRAHHGEDLIGVLMKCGAFHDTDPDIDPHTGDTPGMMALVHAVEAHVTTTYWQRHPPSGSVSPKPEMKSAFLMHQGKPWLRYSWPEGTNPPCFQCGVTVFHPSMDGPLVCPSCDMGKTWMSFRARERFERSSVLKIRLAQTEEDQARVREVGGDPFPSTVPNLAGEMAWLKAVEADEARAISEITEEVPKEDA